VGGGHAFGTYLPINQMDDMQPWLYRYPMWSYILAAVDISNSIPARVIAAISWQAFVCLSVFTFI